MVASRNKSDNDKVGKSYFDFSASDYFAYQLTYFPYAKLI